jgi:hypothetical protein
LVCDDALELSLFFNILSGSSMELSARAMILELQDTNALTVDTPPSQLATPKEIFMGYSAEE